MGSLDTRDQIIYEAVRLFAEQGYEKTTIQAIIDAVGVSKGGFYHHFRSKDEIVEAITEAYIVEGLEYAEQSVLQKDLSTAEKLNEFASVTQVYRKRRQDTREAIEQAFYGEHNLKLEKAILTKMRDRTVPVLKGILAAGIERGDLSIDDPDEYARILYQVLLHMKESLRDHLQAGADREKVASVLRTHEDAICRMLSFPESSLKLTPPYMKRLYEKE